LAQAAKATMIVANSTTLTVNCWVAGSTITSVNVSGYCHAVSVPY
jgi:hypothetical protein